MRKLCSNRGCSRVIAAAIFYPEKRYDKVNYLSINSLGQVWYLCSEVAKSLVCIPGILPGNCIWNNSDKTNWINQWPACLILGVMAGEWPGLNGQQFLIAWRNIQWNLSHGFVFSANTELSSSIEQACKIQSWFYIPVSFFLSFLFWFQFIQNLR